MTIFEKILKILKNVFVKKTETRQDNSIPTPKYCPSPADISEPSKQDDNKKVNSVEHLEFKPGIPNHATDEVTVKLRNIIKDEFGGGVNKRDLQCVEYVQYRVKEKLGIDIVWLKTERPRNGKDWAPIFKKNERYKVFDDPKENCAISFLNPSEYGHVAFVEAVLPDGSIKVSEANWPPPGKKPPTPEGEYSERTLSKAKWFDQYKGQFIDFS